MRDPNALQIVGGYVLHLYCTASDCDAPHPAEFTGRNEREARAAAKRQGWVLRGKWATCAKHSRRADAPRA